VSSQKGLISRKSISYAETFAVPPADLTFSLTFPSQSLLYYFLYTGFRTEQKGVKMNK